MNEDSLLKYPLAIEAIARAAHEMNRRWCQLLGEDSPAPWEEASAEQHASVIAGVHAVLDGATTTPKEQHEAWATMKVAQGWVHGPLKDEAKKTHPCLVPYEDLPPSQRSKGEIFRAVVVGMACLPFEVVEPIDPRLHRHQSRDD